ncbi:hypothetical protein ONS95_003657 [Cadophora gregata]|uniref:uncharacterized protein n=1 Tax=Cadophora gregata TaxID=51156 RepID=UPI0026DAB5F5|nr:uncharacterized protein ONS95_003657 [Cadophora gregata]KAK0106942.1 hypothetical protein ONS95_003657 [Cadophora gregata]
MAVKRGPRIMERAKPFEVSQRASTSSTISTTATQRADESAADTKRSPPTSRLNRSGWSHGERPIVPTRPLKKSHGKDSEPSHQPLPRNDTHRHGGPVMDTNNGQLHIERPLTPQQHAGVYVDSLNTELVTVKAEIASLKEGLTQRDNEIQILGRRLDEMRDQYEVAIHDLKKSQEEKGELRDQVDRLKADLREERSLRRKTEDELEEKQAKVRELNESLTKMSDEKAERARRSALDAEAELARIAGRKAESPLEKVEKKRTSKKHVHHVFLFEDEPQSSVGSRLPSKSSMSVKASGGKSGGWKTRWKP